MRLLFIGDVVGRAGRAAVVEHVPALRRQFALDFVVANGENAAGGFGITEAIAQEFLGAGVDCVTLGNHSFDQREALVFLERAPHVLRPVNYPAGTPGRGSWLYETAAGERVLVVNVMGRVFMDALDDPFAAVEKELSACPLGVGCDAVILDIHAEASSEKQAMAHFCDGRASLAVGTHTHVPTADWRILAHGTAFQSDAGMTGDYDSVIGMDKEEPIRRFTRKTPGSRFEPADGPATLCGLFVETGADGLAKRVAPVRVGGTLAQALPEAG
ncbi:YmdB family metallophosphoesterase [Rhodoblastus acidophilus]|uniref:YmdB family metallophosphoesterase n=1 Tax=Candidatus Rhodoblastus alkanivorans TaxID=2954117 RepID=A0ABS9ZAA6_9HYPH|nr:TIGR00282 family metallophosphoesterase [Candidatus Rhodoblastus alkanivorans]MCI4677873.1 YmdB family metallophosphoesterase [Candidatus Rhodoblastus alkanivorans]MCI4684628.1 YmdB family metallophosphoesterase [Candidatus Rhodoblastus alkanivorans]MDI4641950.1 YmdB family metallophosphoesterase [Rhodoblastus acidophilus]